MNWLFDTCVLSETINTRASQKVLNWIGEISEETIHISILTIGELYKGFHMAADMRKAEKIKNWLEVDVYARFQKRILCVDKDVVAAWGELCAEAEIKGRPRALIDSLVAATARVHHLTVVTRNVSDFQFTGVPVFNPWLER